MSGKWFKNNVGLNVADEAVIMADGFQAGEKGEGIGSTP
jgi:hypothetical protein